MRKGPLLKLDWGYWSASCRTGEWGGGGQLGEEVGFWVGFTDGEADAFVGAGDDGDARRRHCGISVVLG